MSIIIEAIYDGKVFLPVKPLSMKPDTRVRISVVSQDENEKRVSFLDTARAIDLDGPPDWSEKLDEYLYGEKSLNNG